MNAVVRLSDRFEEDPDADRDPCVRCKHFHEEIHGDDFVCFSCMWSPFAERPAPYPPKNLHAMHREAIGQALHVLAMPRDSETAKAVDVSVAMVWLKNALAGLPNAALRGGEAVPSNGVVGL